MPAINAHGEFTPTPENHMTPRPHPRIPDTECNLLISQWNQQLAREPAGLRMNHLRESYFGPLFRSFSLNMSNIRLHGCR